MGTAVIGGLFIGFYATDWLGRFLLPFAVGIIDCIELFYAIHKKPLTHYHRSKLEAEGMSESEIAEVGQTMKLMQREGLNVFKGIGITGWKLYAWQFIWSYLSTLPFFSGCGCD